jgi:hypothetical protein
VGQFLAVVKPELLCWWQQMHLQDDIDLMSYAGTWIKVSDMHYAQGICAAHTVLHSSCCCSSAAASHQ